MRQAVGRERDTKKTGTVRNIAIMTIMLTIQAMTSTGQECKRLDDGQYLFKHTTKGQKKANFLLMIKGDTYFVTKDGQNFPEGKIEWWPDNCMFKLTSSQPPVKKNTDSLSVLEKTFQSYDGYCYEVYDSRKFTMTYCGNVHITLGEGRIVRKRR